MLLAYSRDSYEDAPLFGQFEQDATDVLDDLILKRVFGGVAEDFETWKAAEHAAKRLIWDACTERMELSDLAEEYIRQLAQGLGHAMLLRKGELSRLVRYVDPKTVSTEVFDKLDLLAAVFSYARPDDGG